MKRFGDANLMNFLIRFGFSSFIKGLDAGSTVYGVAFTEAREPKAEGIVLFTSDAGTIGGPIHALRLQIETNGGDEGTATTEAFDKLKELLVLEGMNAASGALLTEGLDEALRLYGNAGPTNLKEIEGFLAEKKKEKDK